MNRGYLYLTIAFFFYGSLYVANKYALGFLPPFTLMFLRQTIALPLLYFVAKRAGMKPIRKEHWKYFLSFGFLSYFLSFGLQTVATSLMNASVAALVNSINPIFISFFAVLILKETMTKRKIFGIACSLLGVALVLGINGEGVSVLGVVISLISVIIWSINAVYTRKIAPHYSSQQMTFFCIGLSVPFFGLTALAEVQFRTLTFTPTVWLVILYLAFFCTALAYLLWNRCLVLLDASVCSLFYPLQPMFASVLGVLLLHETIHANFVAGTLLITIGVLIGLMGSKKTVSTQEAP